MLDGQKTMKITILNGNPYAKNDLLDNYLKRLSDVLVSGNHAVTLFTLRDMQIKYCTGCFRCWTETPGQCVEEDDSGYICREYMNSDFVLFASPIIMGFTSALLRRVQEMLLPLVHPYYIFVKNQIQHLSRYEKYPQAGLLLEKGKDADEEDIGVITDVYRRTTFNSADLFCFTKLISDPVEDLANEINRI